MPPRKKQKTANPTAIPETPADFPNTALLRRALNQHAHALSLRSKEHTKNPDALTELDTWLTDSKTGLSAKISSSQPVDKTDMTSLMKWKLSRGKSRPTLLNLVASNPDALVLKATSAALVVVRDAKDDLERALLALPDACAMKGVGAATASALLTLQPPHLLPFMSDEAASFFAPTFGPIKYTDPFYKKFARAMVAEVGRLNAEASNGVQRWDSMKLERALFTICILRKHGEDGTLEDEGGTSTSPSLKRKRED
ncbi:hypothetical protein DFH07DRAFT_803612 [Mycena maculata]|uniref:Uncharacterized protein n=1 Tax=Mycena maculata TaxID=230809 RepID=A0AAD7NRU7_9AGAR|nr:hypothetical protein DFH07DRAFT_803612 [Mycena maculata]